jgi:16S rRNA (guanine(966)-N(2))-methyltransferase RsmD
MKWRLRVIGGDLKGRRLRGPEGRGIRPTGDRVREALFDILGSRINGSSFLDAYAGTGAVGVEALSRGAAGVTFVEKDRAAVELLRRNVETAGDLSRRARIVPRDLAAALRLLEEDKARFDIVFLDPPYEGGELDRALRLVGRSGVLHPESLIVSEHDARSAPRGDAALPAVRSVRYGHTALTFHRVARGEKAEQILDAR